MERTTKLVIGTTTVAAVSGSILLGTSKFLHATVNQNKRYVRNFIRCHFNNNAHLMMLIEQLSPKDVNRLAIMMAKAYHDRPKPNRAVSEFQQAIQDCTAGTID